MTTNIPSEEEFNAPDEWQQLADACLEALQAQHDDVSLQDSGVLEKVSLGQWNIFHEYKRVLPVFTLHFDNYRKAEISICTTRVSIPRVSAYTAPNTLLTSDISTEDFHTDITSARLYALVFMSNDPGYLYIEPLDIEGAISRLFHKVALDIDGFEEFARHFKVEVGEPEIAQEVLTPYFFELLRDLGPIHLEVKDGWLIAGYKTQATAEQATNLASFVRAIADAL